MNGLVEAINIAGDRWIAWERPVDSTGTPTYVCVNRGLTMKQAELPGIVAELFSDKAATELAKELGITVKDEKYAS
jgi:hypothetical protein